MIFSRRENRSVEKNGYISIYIPSGCAMMSFDGVKNVSFIIFNSKFFQKINVFFCEGSFPMMLFLGFNIIAHIRYLALAI